MTLEVENQAESLQIEIKRQKQWEKVLQILKKNYILDEKDLLQFAEEYKSDERSGVLKLVEKARKDHQKYLLELERIYNLQYFERKYSDYELICGIDEVGRGPLAGPVVAGAVILPKECNILYINDSKKLSAKKREELYPQINGKSHMCKNCSIKS